MKRISKAKRARGVVIGDMERSLPAVRFKRHRTPMSLLKAFFIPMGAHPDEVRETPGMLNSISEMGVWAFCDTRAKPCPVVHYWSSVKANPLHVAYVLGHEVGHVSGRPLRSDKNAWAEEMRADEYGAAAMLALREVMCR